MDEIAKRTGGKAFYETNDLKNAIRLAMDDSKTTYTLGFYPNPVEFNGKFRTLKVRVVGRSDVRLRYREGYIELPEPSRNESGRRARLQNAAWSPLDANAIGLSAKIEPVQEIGGADRLEHLQLKINSPNLSFLERDTAHVAETDIVVVQKTSAGRF